MLTEELMRAFDAVKPAPEGAEEPIELGEPQTVAGVDLGAGPDKTVATVVDEAPPMSVLGAKDAYRIQRARMFTSLVNAMAAGRAPLEVSRGPKNNDGSLNSQGGGPILPRQPREHFPALVGRNDPCPCGSGKKYKKCHVGKDLRTKLD